MMIRRLCIALAGALGLALSVGAADAASCSTSWGKGASAKTRSFTIDSLSSSSAAMECGRGFNTKKKLSKMSGALAGGGWILADKDRARATSGKQTLRDMGQGTRVANNLMTAKRGLRQGRWSLSNFPVASQVLLVLRSGRGFAAYLVDPSELAGDWSSSNRLGRAMIFYRDCQPGAAGCGTPVTHAPAPVPLPAAGGLLLASLGGMAFLRRRRRSA